MLATGSLEASTVIWGLARIGSLEALHVIKMARSNRGEGIRTQAGVALWELRNGMKPTPFESAD